MVESTASDVMMGERILRLYVRMYSVKTFAELVVGGSSTDLEGSALIQFKTRLRNIQKVLFALDKLLAREVAI